MREKTKESNSDFWGLNVIETTVCLFKTPLSIGSYKTAKLQRAAESKWCIPLSWLMAVNKDF